MPFRLTYRPALDGLRGVAILGVFAHHAQVPYLRGGVIGVDIFFVLSGFLITALLLQEADETGRISFPAFYIRRTLRLFPPPAVLLRAFLLFPRGFCMTHAGTAIASCSTSCYA